MIVGSESIELDTARGPGVRSCTTYAVRSPYVSGSLDAVMYACSSVRSSARENGTNGRSRTNSVPSPDGSANIV